MTSVSSLVWDGGSGWSYEHYIESLEYFRDNGYLISPLREFKRLPAVKKVLFLRHDIDFNVDAALKLAKLERSHEIASSYYFRIHAVNYNFLSIRTLKAIHDIHEMGHEVSLHLDHGLSTLLPHETEIGIALAQIELFQKFSGITLEGFSSHEPARAGGTNAADQVLLESALSYHSYQEFFVDRCKYISDSTKRWREKPFREYANEFDYLQVLIHPIWWYSELPQENY
jgi:hypothetical protein